ncbi:DUF2256 domain-containing protein [Vibrio sp. CAU 1672]|nr:DUF2256 domain-containing protein [Vibrio sp. CAU 1672]MDF2152562.1 DUF2256 domain-containing protein [Vibrio sp. CAU 1672]
MKGFKTQLAVKTCPVCRRPFSWRKKWKNNWEHIVFCSQRCRRGKNRQKH